MNENSPILPIFTLKLAATATSLEPSKKGGSNRQSTIKHLPYG